MFVWEPPKWAYITVPNFQFKWRADFAQEWRGAGAVGPSAAPSPGGVPGEAEGSMGFLGAGLYGPLHPTLLGVLLGSVLVP